MDELFESVMEKAMGKKASFQKLAVLALSVSYAMGGFFSFPFPLY